MSTAQSFIPAAGRAGVRGYDRAIALTAREARMRSGMIKAIGASVGGIEQPKILELGCGTGSLTIALAAALPNADLTGLDPDASALAIARAKAGADAVEWIEGGALAPPTAGGGWDAIAISLVMHHLRPDQQPRALRAAREALAPHGTLHVLDFGPPRGLLPRVGFRHALQRLDGVSNTAPMGNGELPGMIAAAGFDEPQLIQRFGTVWGTHEQYAARG
ncbi:MAG: class I SAM-dependent methyltransferase [Solirubrobacterales bacterium]